MTVRDCTRCGTAYSSENCPECRKVYMRDWRQRNREHVAAYNREHYQDQQQWRRDHPERVAEANRRYTQKVNGRPQREYEQRNKAAQATRRRIWKQKNVDKVREYTRRRESWKAGADPIDYEAILTRDGRVCHLCGKAITSTDDLHFDHVIPLSRGGKHAADNIRTAHAACNYAKNDRLPNEAKARRKR